MNHANHSQSHVYSVKTFLPLMLLSVIIVLCTVLKQSLFGFSPASGMYDFMGFFFLIFSFFKIINLNRFVQAYSMYDIIAKRSQIYAYMYPFIELTLGVLYLMRYKLAVANGFTLALMIIGSIGVAYELMQGRDIVCACLGAVFKIPMTYVTLAEDLFMGGMALIMLFN